MMTTDEMDSTTPEERNKVVGYCEVDEEWWYFTKRPEGNFCPKCGSRPSQLIGFQIISQRTFNPLTHGKKKLKKKK